MAPNPVLLIQQHDLMKTLRSPYEPDWREIIKYIHPKRIGIAGSRARLSRMTRDAFNSTPIEANEIFAYALAGSITSSSAMWFQLEHRIAELNKIPSVKKWLEECTRRIHAAKRQSNYYAEKLECYLDYGAFGMYALFAEERGLTPAGGFGGLRYRALPIGEYCIDEDADGRVDTLFRLFELSARAIVQMFQKDRVSERIHKLAETKPMERVPVLHVVRPRAGIEQKPPAPNTPQDKMPVESVHVELLTKQVLREGGFRMFPLSVPRFSKSSGEMYGQGPGHTALPAVKRLNRLDELDLKARNKALDPPVVAEEDSVIGDMETFAGGMNIVRRGAKIDVLESKSRFEVIDTLEHRLEEQIRRIFKADHLRLKESPAMTAEEVRTRYQLMQRLLGPALGRLEDEGLNAEISRDFDLMYQTGGLPPAPAEVLEAAKTANGNIDIKYSGPLAKSQQEGEADAIVYVYGVAAPLAQIEPEVMDVLDADESIRRIAAVKGMPTECIRDAAKTEERRKQRQAAAAAAAEGAQAVDKAKALKDMATAYSTGKTAGMPMGGNGAGMSREEMAASEAAG